mmetsp:Transcript_24942/g.68517  ORF Transcript_24942/g.68517 Transcript_24942/m.68517 type:complete len:85 (+) Transcript_24942:510-764(+)
MTSGGTGAKMANCCVTTCGEALPRLLKQWRDEMAAAFNQLSLLDVGRMGPVSSEPKSQGRLQKVADGQFLPASRFLSGWLAAHR